VGGVRNELECVACSFLAEFEMLNCLKVKSKRNQTGFVAEANVILPPGEVSLRIIKENGMLAGGFSSSNWIMLTFYPKFISERDTLINDPVACLELIHVISNGSIMIWAVWAG